MLCGNRPNHGPWLLAQALILLAMGPLLAGKPAPAPTAAPKAQEDHSRTMSRQVRKRAA
jgi:hypothetical protein